MGHSTRRLMMGSAGAASGGAKYVDDIFKTFLYTGNQTARDINIGIDMASDGGMTWLKGRDNLEQHYLHDSTMVAGKALNSNNNSTGYDDTSRFNTFTSTGFSVGNDDGCNKNTKTYSSWTYRKAPGFFDVVTYTGNGATSRSISHELGSVPGMIIIKNLSNNADWAVYHRSITASKYLSLNKTDGANNGGEWFADGTEPTASVFSVGNQVRVNGNGDTYVAYIFAGGASTNALARSVNFDGSGDYLSLAASSDFAFGTGDFTIECWVKPTTTSNPDGVFNLSSTTGGLTTAYNLSMAHQGSSGDNKWRISYGAGTQLAAESTEPVKIGQWYHLAYVRASGVSKLYVNGIEKISVSDTTNYSYQNLAIGGYYSTSYLWKGDISNFRVVNGTALYTSSFRPPTEPLTNITNTKLLCCNNSSTTGSTITPGTITANGDPTASSDSPFLDPAGFVFGENEDQGVIKCGSYKGTGAANNEVYLGWEPQFVLFKNTSSSDAWSNWFMYDDMRGVPTGDDDNHLLSNKTDTESAYSGNCIDFTPTSFIIQNTGVAHNENGSNFSYIAIRRPDGLVGKPPVAATEVFTMDGQGNYSDPTDFISNFPVGFGLIKQPASNDLWYTTARKMGNKYLQTNSTAWFGGYSFAWDNNNGFCRQGFDANYQAWMWKRSTSFDVVTYKGNSGGDTSGDWQVIPHNLGRVPEMIWSKSSDQGSGYWGVYHKGLNNGTNPWNYRLLLNGSQSESDGGGSYTTWYWNDTAPTATHFSVGEISNTNSNTGQFYAMLFASIEGVSKVGWYTGTGAAGNTQTTGFTPRFILVKCMTDTVDWGLFDSVRGLGSSGNDKRLYLNTTAAQVDGNDYLTTSATGFTPAFVGSSVVNSNGQRYLYYAHA